MPVSVKRKQSSFFSTEYNKVFVQKSCITKYPQLKISQTPPEAKREASGDVKAINSCGYFAPVTKRAIKTIQEWWTLNCERESARWLLLTSMTLSSYLMIHMQTTTLTFAYSFLCRSALGTSLSKIRRYKLNMFACYLLVNLSDTSYTHILSWGQGWRKETP